MDKAPNLESAAQRAHWLGELSVTLDAARHLVKELGGDEGRIEAVELYARIEAARFEVQAMRLRRSLGDRQDLDREWTKDIPWKRSA